MNYFAYRESLRGIGETPACCFTKTSTNGRPWSMPKSRNANRDHNEQCCVNSITSMPVIAVGLGDIAIASVPACAHRPTTVAGTIDPIESRPSSRSTCRAASLSKSPPSCRRTSSAASTPPSASVWSFDVELATGEVRQRILSEIASFSRALSRPSPSGGPRQACAHRRLLATRRVRLTAREYDRSTQRWGMPIRRESRQPEALPEQVFALLCQAVAPLAHFELDPNDERLVVLKPRAAASCNELLQASRGPGRAMSSFRSCAAPRAAASLPRAASRTCRGPISKSSSRIRK